MLDYKNLSKEELARNLLHEYSADIIPAFNLAAAQSSLRESVLVRNFSYFEDVLSTLPKDKKYIDIGSGTGILKYLGRSKGYDISNADVSGVNRLFKDSAQNRVLESYSVIRDVLDSGIDINMTKLFSSEQFTIDTYKKFDASLIINFPLFKIDDIKAQYNKDTINREFNILFDELERVSRQIVIFGNISRVTKEFINSRYAKISINNSLVTPIYTLSWK